jgi:hypothetical protein
VIYDVRITLEHRRERLGVILYPSHRRSSCQTSVIMRTIIAAFTLGYFAEATALTCSSKSPREIANTAEVAFVGEITAVEDSEYSPHPGLCRTKAKDSKCGGKLASFRVTEVIRGDVPPTVTVLSEDGCYCLGHYWKVKDSYLVIATSNTTKHRGSLVASNVCGGTGPLNERSSAVIEALRASKR